MIRLILFFSFICPLVSVGQNFTVEYEEKFLEIDSVVIFDYEGNRVDKYSNLTKDDLVSKQLELVTVIYLGYKKKKLCLDIIYDRILCDIIMISLSNFPSKCKYVYETVGAYHTCQGMSHMIGFYSNYLPCCKNEKKRRKSFKGG